MPASFYFLLEKAQARHARVDERERERERERKRERESRQKVKWSEHERAKRLRDMEKIISDKSFFESGVNPKA